MRPRARQAPRAAWHHSSWPTARPSHCARRPPAGPNARPPRQTAPDTRAPAGPPLHPRQTGPPHRRAARRPHGGASHRAPLPPASRARRRRAPGPAGETSSSSPWGWPAATARDRAPAHSPPRPRHSSRCRSQSPADFACSRGASAPAASAPNPGWKRPSAHRASSGPAWPRAAPRRRRARSCPAPAGPLHWVLRAHRWPRAGHAPRHGRRRPHPALRRPVHAAAASCGRSARPRRCAPRAPQGRQWRPQRRPELQLQWGPQASAAGPACRPARSGWLASPPSTHRAGPSGRWSQATV